MPVHSLESKGGFESPTLKGDITNSFSPLSLMGLLTPLPKQIPRFLNASPKEHFKPSLSFPCSLLITKMYCILAKGHVPFAQSSNQGSQRVVTRLWSIGRARAETTTQAYCIPKPIFLTTSSPPVQVQRSLSQYCLSKTQTDSPF